MEILIVLLPLVALIALAIGLIQWWRTVDTVLHDVFCVCWRCKDKMIRDEIKRRDWRSWRQTVEQSVNEVERIAKGRP